MTYGKIVRTYRERLGMTQEQLAGKAGVGVRTIRAIESGTISRSRPTTVSLLADALGMDTAERGVLFSAPMGAATGGPAPAQLPPRLSGFTGRAPESAFLLDVLRSHAGAGTDATVTVVSGPAGVGKSALATNCGHQVAAGFPDGQLFVELHRPGGDRRMVSPGEALGGLLGALGVRSELIPPDLGGRSALWRTVLAGKRVLLVLDDARDDAHVQPLLPSGQGSRTVITSRNKLTGLIARTGGWPVSLRPFTDDEARELLRRRLGAERLAAEPAAVDLIVRRCAGSPSALATAAAHVLTRPSVSLYRVACSLGDPVRPPSQRSPSR
jgi:transcriptional regulator with XRE-family HTH domain